MKFIDLNSEDYYNLRDNKSIKICVFKQSIYHSELIKDCEYKIDDIIIAGWTRERSFKCKIVNVVSDYSWNFDDENKWDITLRRVQDEIN